PTFCPFPLTRPPPPRPPTSTLFPYTTLFRSLDIQVTLSRLAAKLVRLTFLFLVGLGMLLILALVAPGEFTFFSFFGALAALLGRDRKSTRLNSSHVSISYAVFCLKKKKK